MLERLLRNWTKERVKQELTDHVINATAINLTANILYGSFERGVLGQTLEQIRHARYEGTLATYLYAGTAWGKVRDVIHNKLEGRPVVQALAVGTWSFGFNMGVCEVLYRNTEHPHINSLIAGVVSFPFGIVIGYAKDIARDYIGRERKKLPPMFEWDEKTKHRAAAAFAVGSVAYTAALCYLR